MIERWQEKRKFPRVPLKVELQCQIRGINQSNRAITNDIGLGGLSFTNEGFIPTDTLLNLEIRLLSKTLSTTAKTVRVILLPFSDRYNFGVEFTDLDTKQRDYLEDYLNMRLGNI